MGRIREGLTVVDDANNTLPSRELLAALARGIVEAKPLELLLADRRQRVPPPRPEPVTFCISDFYRDPQGQTEFGGFILRSGDAYGRIVMQVPDPEASDDAALVQFVEGGGSEPPERQIA